ncbi:MAG: hypothetical protein WAL63_00980 [Solirubrobacteraceae bacterium]
MTATRQPRAAKERRRGLDTLNLPGRKARDLDARSSRVIADALVAARAADASL